MVNIDYNIIIDDKLDTTHLYTLSIYVLQVIYLQVIVNIP